MFTLGTPSFFKHNPARRAWRRRGGASRASMTEVICLDDSDDDVAAPAAASRPPSRVAAPPPARPPFRSDVARGAQPRAVGDDGSGTSSSDDEGIFTDRTANRRAAKKRRVAAVLPRDASETDRARTAPPRASGSAPDGVPASPAAARAAKARAAEETRRRKAEERELVRQAKELEKVAKANAKHRAALLGGKHKLRQITTSLSSDLLSDDFGRALADAFAMGVVDDGDGRRSVVPLFLTNDRESDKHPLPRSVTWRYHAPSTTPVGVPDASVVSAEHIVLYFTGGAFVAACLADHDAGVHARKARLRSDEDLFPDELPELGLERLLATARRKLPGHTIGLLVEGARRECSKRERREFRAPPSFADSGKGVAFARAIVEDAIARLYVDDGGNGTRVRVTCVPDLGASVRHAVGVTVALAKRPFERDVSALDILAHNKSKITPAAALALEAAAAGGSRGAGTGNDGDVSNSNETSMGKKRLKTSAETWCSALMTIDGCAESSALAIVRAFPTMASLMREYNRTDLTERAKKELLSDLTRAVTSETQSKNRRVGPVVSARAYEILRPRDARDAGDEIVGVGA
jgi:hypothetical protein